MGISIIVPGISGSIVALMMNLYDDLLYSISTLFKNFKKNFYFLFPIMIGCGIGLIIGLIIIKKILYYYPFIAFCFFDGLMIGSILLHSKRNKINFFKNKNIVLFLLGLVIPIILLFLSIINKNNVEIVEYNLKDYLIIFLIGLIVSITQLIPGLSATICLIILGYYSFLLNLIDISTLFNCKKMLLILSFALGIVLGILIFCKSIKSIKDRYYNYFYSLIRGLSYSSVICLFFNNECLIIYKNWTNGTIFFDILFGFVSVIIGMIMIFLFFENNEVVYEKK